MKKTTVPKKLSVKKNVVAETHETHVENHAETHETHAGLPAAKPTTNVVPVIHKHALYIEVSPDKYFVLCDGRKVKNAKELADILQLINDDMFKYHVTDSKNDFSNWVNDVFGEPDLAKKLRTVRNRLETSIELYRYMFHKLEQSTKK